MAKITGCMMTLFLLSTYCFSESTTRSVQADFDRCSAAIERTKRDLLRLEITLKKMRKILDNHPGSADSRGELQQLDARFEYLNNRINRTSGQKDKINSDLRNLKGPTCPSCITSSVDLYCRSSETIRTELDAFTSRAGTLYDAIHTENNLTGDASFSERRATIEKSVTQNSKRVSECSSAAGKTLWKQSRINLERADSLHAAGATQQSLETLSLVELLVTRAVQKCSKE